MTGGRSSVLSTIGREARGAVRETVGDAVRLAVGILFAAVGLALLWVGIVRAAPFVAVIGAAVLVPSAAWLCLDSAVVSWLRDRRKGRTWRWS
jgi:hypothetical protein